MKTKIVLQNIETFAEEYKGEKFHAVLCDAPYGLGKNKARPLLESWLSGASGEPAAPGRGFMGRDWDTIPAPAIWEAIKGICLPGAVMMCFAGTRTADLVSVAIRLGGWKKFDQILHWTYGSGYPKIHDISLAIDRESGNDRPDHLRGTPVTDAAKMWDGYATLIKPAQEPVLCFRAPMKDTYADNVSMYGASGLNVADTTIDGGGYDPRQEGKGWRQDKAGVKVYAGSFERDGRHTSKLKGRWPANLIMSHLPGCRRIGSQRVKSSKPRKQKIAKEYHGNSTAGAFNPPEGLVTSGYADGTGKEAIAEWDCEDACPVKELSEQSGHLKSGKNNFIKKAAKGGNPRNTYGAESREAGTEMVRYGDEGTAARFFHQSDWNHEIFERVVSASVSFYQAKPSKKEKNAGIVKDAEAVNDGRKKDIDNPYQRGTIKRKNTHPTIKPITLLKYLATMLLPPAEYAPRRILVPFCGSGSEIIGAMLAGWDEIVGVEIMPEYVELAQPRVDWWTNVLQYGATEVNEIIQAWDLEQEGDQLKLF